MSVPKSSTVPSVGVSSADMHLSSVVFPPPELPIRATVSPLFTSIEMSCSTVFSPNRCVRSRTRIMPGSILGRFLRANGRILRLMLLRKTPLLLAFACLPAVAAAPFKILCTKGETLKYKVSVSSTETNSFKGDTAEIKLTGSHVMTMKVSTVSGGVATMTVAYSGATTSATATSLPPELKKDKSKIEQAAANALKAALSTGARSQKVKSNGSATYSISAGEGQT